MNYSKIGIDTMGRADNPDFDIDWEREKFYSAEIFRLFNEGDLAQISIDYDRGLEKAELNDALIDFCKGDGHNNLRSIIQVAIEEAATKATNEKFYP